MEEKDLLEEQNEASKEEGSELSEYEQKLNEYQYKLEEALVNIEVKENIALANEEDSNAFEEYKKAKADYEALRKEYKQYKKENAPITWWNSLPLRVKIVSFVNLLFAFPFLSYSVIHLWYYPYLWFYQIFSDGLNKLYDNGKEILTYIYLGVMWYLISAILASLVVVLFIMRGKKDVLPEYKKTYIGFIIGNALLVLGLIAYEIVAMINMWS